MMVPGAGSPRSLTPRPAQVNHRGFALAAALLAVVMIGALIAGVLFATTEETRVGAAGVDREVALNACESAIAMTITDPGLSLPDSIGVGGTVSGLVAGLERPIVVYITRLDSALYSIVAEAVPEPASTGATRRIGVVVRSSIADGRSITVDPISERPWLELF
jgi:Tfp pilus assembly protein PilX